MTKLGVDFSVTVYLSALAALLVTKFGVDFSVTVYGETTWGKVFVEIDVSALIMAVGIGGDSSNRLSSTD